MSDLEDAFAFQLDALGLSYCFREYQAIPGRKFRWDFAFVGARLLIEVQGGTWHVGAHSSGTGLERDMTKLCLATLAGWRVLQFSRKMIESGAAVEMVRIALGGEK